MLEIKCVISVWSRTNEVTVCQVCRAVVRLMCVTCVLVCEACVCDVWSLSDADPESVDVRLVSGGFISCSAL